MNDEAYDNLVDAIKQHIDFRSQVPKSCFTCHHSWLSRTTTPDGVDVETRRCNLLNSTLGVTFKVEDTDVCDKHRGEPK